MCTPRGGKRGERGMGLQLDLGRECRFSPRVLPLVQSMPDKIYFLVVSPVLRGVIDHIEY